MHASVVASVLLAAVAFAKPIANPAVVTEVTYVTEVVHVYVDAAEATPAPEVEQKHQRGSHRWDWGRHRHNDDKKAEATTTTEVVTETAAPQAPPAEEQYVPPPAEEAPVQEQPQQQTEEKPKEEQQQTQEEAPEQQYAPAQTAPSGSYRQKCLDHHNMHRLNHSAPALLWDDELEAIAQTTANTCYYDHDTKTGGGGYGQNIAAGVEGENIGYVITGQFYNDEFKLYPGFGTDPSKSRFSEWGHLSQILWKDTTHVACVTKDCTAQGLGGPTGGSAPYFTVCNYKSAGNVAGGYAKNVLPPRGDPFFGVTR